MVLLMSRQRTPQPDSKPDRKKNSFDRQLENEQLVAMQGQLDQCQQQQRQLIRSRNYAIMTALAAVAGLIYLLLLQPPKDSSGQQQALIARQLASHKEQLSKQQRIENKIQQAVQENYDQSLVEDADATISRIEKVLNDQPLQARAEITDPRVKWRDKQAISRMLHLWAVAWEIKDLPRYFSFYSRNFDPQDTAQNQQEWRARRSYLIDKPDSISVIIEDVDIKQLRKDAATVSFNQHYQTPDYADQAHKLMELVREDDQWKILTESSATTQVNLKGKR
jgi:hypothetical protein